jgi:hypothetical protein
MRYSKQMGSRIRGICRSMGDQDVLTHEELRDRLGLEGIGVWALREFMVGSGIVWDNGGGYYRKSRSRINRFEIVRKRLEAFKEAHGL